MPLHKSGLSTRGPCVNMQTPPPPPPPLEVPPTRLVTAHWSPATGHWSLVYLLSRPTRRAVGTLCIAVCVRQVLLTGA